MSRPKFFILIIIVLLVSYIKDAFSSYVPPTPEKKDKIIRLIRLNSSFSEWRELTSLAESESRFDQFAEGLHGEIGIFQISPKTAEKECGIVRKNELYDAEINIICGIKYWKKLKSEFRTIERTYFAWNLGLKKVRGKDLSQYKCNSFRSVRCHYNAMMLIYNSEKL